MEPMYKRPNDVAASQGRLSAVPAHASYHEMRSPLSLISTLAQSAGTSSDVQVIQRQLATIQRIADRTLRTVSEVLYGHKSSEPGGSVPLARVVAALVRDHRQAGQRVDLGIQGTMPRISSGACALLEALLESLLANAFDHGDAALPVSVRLSITEGVLNISVSNAIADEPDHSGLGVGTDVVTNLVSRLGGSIRWEQTDAEFTVTVDIARTAIEKSTDAVQ